jgi:hypothetical protein
VRNMTAACRTSSPSPSPSRRSFAASDPWLAIQCAMILGALLLGAGVLQRSLRGPSVLPPPSEVEIASHAARTLAGRPARRPLVAPELGEFASAVPICEHRVRPICSRSR